MPDNATELLLALFLAHFLLDFPLQPSGWVAQRYSRRQKAPTLYLHALAHGVASGGCFWLFDAGWQVSLVAGGVVLVAHFLTDLVKTFLPRTSLLAFIGDQVAHWLVLLALWAFYIGLQSITGLLQGVTLDRALLLLLAYLIVMLPMSVVISLCLSPWIAEVRQLESDQNSLAKAGAMIGYLERLLILTFVLIGEFTAVGFVLTIKAAFRFKDTDDRRKAEYMMMGTFLSFGLTIAFGLAVRHLLQML